MRKYSNLVFISSVEPPDDELLEAAGVPEGGSLKHGGKAEENVTKTEVKGSSKDGWHFNVYYGDRTTAGMVSASYKTEEEAEKKLKRFLETGKYDLYGSSEMKHGGEAGQEFEYIKLVPKEHGLEVQLTKEGIQKIKEDGITYQNADEYFEDIQGNSEFIYHNNLGDSGLGMTEAEGITDGYYFGDEGGYKTDHPDSAKLYYFNDYAIRFWGDDLKEEGKAFFQEHKELKTGGKVDETKNFYRIRLASPKNVTTCAVPEWAQKVAEATQKGAKITMCKKDKKWFIQSIMIPKDGLKASQAKKMAKEIQSKFGKKKKALGGVAETVSCEEINQTIAGIEAMRDTSDNTSDKKRYQELLNDLGYN